MTKCLNTMMFCKICWNLSKKKTRQINRLKMLMHYSGGVAKCHCCNELNIEFLTIDHINGGGRQHVMSLNCSLQEWIIRNEYPDGFRVLCMNCNFAIGKYGYCPHVEKSRVIVELPSEPRRPCGEKHGNSKLSETDIREIRTLKNEGWSVKKIADRFGISRTTAHRICNRVLWRHIT